MIVKEKERIVGRVFLFFGPAAEPLDEGYPETKEVTTTTKMGKDECDRLAAACGPMETGSLFLCVVAVWELFGSPLKVVDAPLMMVVVGCPRFQLRHRNALFITLMLRMIRFISNHFFKGLNLESI